MSAAREQLAELIVRLREQCQWKTEMPCERDPLESRCVSCRAADALETLALRAPQSGPLDGIISDVERVFDAKMWRDRNGELTWRGETPDGNEIETEPPRVLLASALAALRTLRAGSGAETPPPSPDELLVTDFGVAMAERLRAASRRGRSGWQEMSPKQLLRRAEQELGELRAAVAANAPELDVVHEAADVGNFCAMLATVYDRGAEPPPQPEIPK